MDFFLFFPPSPLFFPLPQAEYSLDAWQHELRVSRRLAIVQHRALRQSGEANAALELRLLLQANLIQAAEALSAAVGLPCNGVDLYRAQVRGEKKLIWGNMGEDL